MSLIGAGGEALLSEADCRVLISAALDRGNAGLALAIYEAMSGSARASASGSASGSFDGAADLWPYASLETVTALVLGLAKALRVKDALLVRTLQPTQ